MGTLPINDLAGRLALAPGYKTLEAAARSGLFPLNIEGGNGGYLAFVFARLSLALSGPLAIVTPSEREAEALISDLELVGCEASLLPWWGTVPYQAANPHTAVFAERATTLSRLLSGEIRVLVCSQRAFQGLLPDPKSLKAALVSIKRGGTIDPEAISEKLSSYGYLRVPRVGVPGEYALRGEVLDLFMFGDDEAYRIVFEYDKVDEIKRFRAEDQASTGRAESLTIRPMREILWNEESISTLKSRLAELPEMAGGSIEFLDTLAEGRECPGEELYYPLSTKGIWTLDDYLGENASLCLLEYERLANAQEVFDKEYAGLYKRAKSIGPVPSPERLILPFAKREESFERRIRFLTISGTNPKAVKTIQLGSEPPRSFFGNVNYLRDELEVAIKSGYSVNIFAESDSQALRIGELLKELKLKVYSGGLSAGFSLLEPKTLVVQENEIFGRKRRIPKQARHAQTKIIDSFIELNPGDYVVHVNYGVGRFEGIDRLKVLGNERDYIKLLYADEETVFIPIEQVNLVQRYIGSEGNDPRLDKLGGKSWENRKSKVRKSVEDLAQRLVLLYSKRKMARGYAFPTDTEWQNQFEAAFPYDETEDQLKCVEDIKSDMESTQPMDRMVCGDVGYGKTEVAFRAIFKAIAGGKQVVLLAPTTILAEQHFETAQERFAGFPVNIAMLSRLIEPAEQKKTLARLASGGVDLLIGTHRVLQKDVIFHDIGLIVIDEEQRFGVKDKERLKELKSNVDCLTLTATPIPRTLHMSLLKIRDMSLITTPPVNRHPIETFIEEFQDAKIADAIRAEVARGGQVFYLHNRIESLEETRTYLERLVPEMLVDTAHGQMDPTELENIMHRFIHGGFHVLISTTIIENGIDIPNVNTIIIDRADMYGISQLYQLRGRVGRSDRKAYAYLLYPSGKAISEIAMKRLQIISDFTELGSGFKIAMKDMEVRGAGNLLGREQSGAIFAVGFDMYLRILDEAVAELQNQDYEPEVEAYLELEYSGFIPDSYIALPQAKMEVYKKIASVASQDELERVHSELLDRFGPIPDEVSSLLALSELKVLCKTLAILSIREREGVARVEFGKLAKISVDKVIRMMKEGGDRVRVDPMKPNVLVLKTGAIGLKEKSEFIRERLSALTY